MSFPSDFILPILIVRSEDDYCDLAGNFSVASTTTTSAMLSSVSLESTPSACAAGHMRDTLGKHEGLVLQDPRAKQAKRIAQ